MNTESLEAGSESEEAIMGRKHLVFLYIFHTIGLTKQWLDGKKLQRILPHVMTLFLNLTVISFCHHCPCFLGSGVGRSNAAQKCTLRCSLLTITLSTERSSRGIRTDRAARSFEANRDNDMATPDTGTR